MGAADGQEAPPARGTSTSVWSAPIASRPAPLGGAKGLCAGGATCSGECLIFFELWIAAGILLVCIILVRAGVDAYRLLKASASTGSGSFATASNSTATRPKRAQRASSERRNHHPYPRPAPAAITPQKAPVRKSRDGAGRTTRALECGEMCDDGGRVRGALRLRTQSRRGYE